MSNGVIRTRLDLGALNGKFNKGIDKAQKWLDNEVIADTSPYLPFMTGELSKSVRVAEAGLIEYNTPYARKMYYGDNLNFNTMRNALAGAYWFERSKGVNSKKWADGVNQIMRGEV